MAIQTVIKTTIDEYTAGSGQTSYVYSFQVSDALDLFVCIDGVPQVGGFTVTDVGNESGGTIVFSTAPYEGVGDAPVILIFRDAPESPLYTALNNGPFLAKRIESEFLRVYQNLEELKDHSLDQYSTDEQEMRGGLKLGSDLDMNQNNIVNLADAVNGDDAVNLDQLFQIVQSPAPDDDWGFVTQPITVFLDYGSVI